VLDAVMLLPLPAGAKRIPGRGVLFAVGLLRFFHAALVPGAWKLESDIISGLRPVSGLFGCPFHEKGTDIDEIINLTSSQPMPPVPIIAMAMQDGMDNYRISFQGEENPKRKPLGRYTPDFVAAADNRKRERIFQGACDRLIDCS
jgi:hypothetical protein